MLKILCIIFCIYEYRQNLTRWGGALIKLYNDHDQDTKLEGAYSLNMHYILVMF
jgi:hypothetical protein